MERSLKKQRSESAPPVLADLLQSAVEETAEEEVDQERNQVSDRAGSDGNVSVSEESVLPGRDAFPFAPSGSKDSEEEIVAYRPTFLVDGSVLDSGNTTTSGSEPQLSEESVRRTEELARRLAGSGPKAPVRSFQEQRRSDESDNFNNNENNDSIIPDLSAVPTADPVMTTDTTSPVLKTDPVTVATDSSSVPAKKSDMIIVTDLRKGYVKARKLIPVLQGINMTVGQGEFLAIVGQSGSGKSTLLHLMGTLDVPDSGTIYFGGQRIDNLPIRKRDLLRNRYIGMIFQFYHLIPEMTTLENVLAPLMIRDGIFQYLRNRRNYHRQAKELLDLVGLTHRLRHRPGELSGGEMQRASIARALITQPSILLADEPTGNLDSKTSSDIIKLLRGLNREQNLTIVMVTHDVPQAEEADRIIRLVDGEIVS